MSLLQQALSLISDQLEGKSEEWLGKLIEKLEELIQSTENEELREGGLKALDVLKSNKERFQTLGKKSFILFIAHVAANRDDEAAKEYYRTKASAREIIDSILDDALDLDMVRQQKEAIFSEALDLVGTIAGGAKYLLPFLLAVV